MDDAQYQELIHRFQYHPPTNDAVREAHEFVRKTFRETAVTVAAALPGERPREEALMITKIEEAMFWANAAIARHWGSEGGTPNPEEEDNGGSGSE